MVAGVMRVDHDVSNTPEDVTYCIMWRVSFILSLDVMNVMDLYLWLCDVMQQVWQLGLFLSDRQSHSQRVRVTKKSEYNEAVLNRVF